jgi:hypothetical protein
MSHGGYTASILKVFVPTMQYILYLAMCQKRVAPVETSLVSSVLEQQKSRLHSHQIRTCTFTPCAELPLNLK